MAFRLCLLLSFIETVLFSQGTISYIPFRVVTIFVLFSVQFSAVLLYRSFLYPFYLSPLRHLPGPKNGNILFGQAMNLLTAEGPNDYPLKWMHEHPEAPLIRYIVAGSEWVLVNSVQASRDILHTACYSFEKPNWFRRIVGEIAGVGLVNADGDVHKGHRKVLNGAFTLPNYRKLLPMFNEKAGEFSSAIEASVEQQPDESIEVSKMLSQTTLDVIGRASLGVELGSLSTGSSTFHHLYDQLLNLPPVGALIFVLNIFLPVRRWIPLKANWDFMHASSEVQRLLLKTIRKRKTEVFAKDGKINAEYLEEGSQNDYLTFMIREKSTSEDRWSDEEIMGHLMNFMSAGHETTAGVLVWAVLSMCLNPDIQDRLRTEIRDSIPHSNSPRYEELEKLQYMNIFLKEVLRCFPASTRIPRAPIRPITLDSVPDLVIPAGTSLSIHPAVLSFNPTIWGPDTHIFNPDRHNPKHPSVKEYPQSRDPYALATFSNGPRICIGRGFAMLEMKSILVEMLRHWEVKRAWGKEGERLGSGEEPSGDKEGKSDVDKDGLLENKLFGGVKVQNFITLRPRNGLWVRFSKIV